MILDKFVNIKINSGNYRHFKELGYSFEKVGDIINIDTTHLMRGSAFKIKCSCVECNAINTILYKNYIKQTLNDNDYMCKKCSSVTKSPKTNISKYGVEYVSQSEIVKNKIKESNIKKYNSESYLHSNEFKIKMELLYGNEFPLKNLNLREKAKQTTFNNYGVFYPKQSNIVLTNEKINSNLKYGVSHYSKTNEYKFKFINTCLGRYGVTNPSFLDSTILKIKKTKIDNGIQIPDELINDFTKYRRIVNKHTNNNKKKLYESWNGYDYYDNEYILEYLLYKYTHKLYPTIDHKISIYKGFIDNILPNIIGSIDNLCITKRGINSSKNKKTEDEFKTN
jgi:hypothetical protein